MTMNDIYHGVAGSAEWMSYNITYGVFLAPCAETMRSAPLTFPETEMIALSCLIAQRALRETVWHLRGSLRNGLGSEEVESIQTAIEMVAAKCGVDVKSGMPRVQDVLPGEQQSDV